MEEEEDVVILPTIEIPSTNEIPSREVTNLIKIYQDEEKKFGGELYDILGAKLQVF